MLRDVKSALHFHKKSQFGSMAHPQPFKVRGIFWKWETPPHILRYHKNVYIQLEVIQNESWTKKKKTHQNY